MANYYTGAITIALSSISNISKWCSVHCPSVRMWPTCSSHWSVGSLNTAALFFPFCFSFYEAFMRSALPVINIACRELTATDPPLEITSSVFKFHLWPALMTWHRSDWVPCLHCPQTPFTLYTIIRHKLLRQLHKYVFLMQNQRGHFEVTSKLFSNCGWKGVFRVSHASVPKVFVNFVHRSNVWCQGADPCWKTLSRWHCQ